MLKKVTALKLIIIWISTNKKQCFFNILIDFTSWHDRKTWIFFIVFDVNTFRYQEGDWKFKFDFIIKNCKSRNVISVEVDS